MAQIKYMSTTPNSKVFFSEKVILPTIAVYEVNGKYYVIEGRQRVYNKVLSDLFAKRLEEERK